MLASCIQVQALYKTSNSNMKISGNLIIISSSGGAILGGSISGPIGAVVGAIVGAIAALVSGNQDNIRENGSKNDEQSNHTTQLKKPEAFAQ
jgi:hypothetical protein